MTENFTPAKAGTQRPRLSKEEYAEKKRAEKDGVYQLADEAAKEIISSPEKFKAFLDTQSRLDRYSAVNALLIYKQYRQAVQLKDFDDWSKENIKITKGATVVPIWDFRRYVSDICFAKSTVLIHRILPLTVFRISSLTKSQRKFVLNFPRREMR